MFVSLEWRFKFGHYVCRFQENREFFDVKTCPNCMNCWNRGLNTQELNIWKVKDISDSLLTALKMLHFVCGRNSVKNNKNVYLN